VLAELAEPQSTGSGPAQADPAQHDPTALGGSEQPRGGATGEGPGPESSGVVVTRGRARSGPALFFLGCVAVVAIGGVALALAGSGGKQAGGASLGRLRGVAMAARAGKPILQRVSTNGEPPSDVVAAIVVPDGTTVTSAKRPGPAISLYSATVHLAVSYDASQVVTFFRRELAHDHWSVLAVDSTASGNGTQIFAKIPSSDGYYWEIGVVVNPVTASITPALGGGDSEPTSTVSLTVFEVDDAD
jgi:hypothetical protein